MKNIKWEINNKTFNSQLQIAAAYEVTIRCVQKWHNSNRVKKIVLQPQSTKKRIKYDIYTPYGIFKSMSEAIAKEPLTNRGNIPSPHTMRSRFKSTSFPDYYIKKTEQ
ncbi:hypothetical protein [Aliivibrio fischeri]|uniref:hypothetical protein n=1 Tax=Aliivibrio fischeri TaxID=668 RepID=UPI0012D859A9|nr:hypothetical protein [Aliivibrio fischeri]MUJ20444.1 hypothetical protein [Aliivibrio fischeri]